MFITLQLISLQYKFYFFLGLRFHSVSVNLKLITTTRKYGTVVSPNKKYMDTGHICRRGAFSYVTYNRLELFCSLNFVTAVIIILH